MSPLGLRVTCKYDFVKSFMIMIMMTMMIMMMMIKMSDLKSEGSS